MDNMKIKYLEEQIQRSIDDIKVETSYLLGEKNVHEYILYSKHRATISRRLIDIKNYCTELKKELY